MFRIIICGDRNWTDAAFIKKTLRQVVKKLNKKEIKVIDGGCRGADEFGNWAAIVLNYKTKRVFAEWFKYGKSAGPIRNRKMLALNPHLVLAFHDDLKNSKGTKDMIAAAEAAGVKVQHFKH